jgi:hypothetical protein
MMSRPFMAPLILIRPYGICFMYDPYVVVILKQIIVIVVIVNSRLMLEQQASKTLHQQVNKAS